MTNEAHKLVSHLLDQGEEMVETYYHRDGRVEVFLPSGGSHIFHPED